jgi:hypothetical protein
MSTILKPLSLTLLLWLATAMPTAASPSLAGYFAQILMLQR